MACLIESFERGEWKRDGSSFNFLSCVHCLRSKIQCYEASRTLHVADISIESLWSGTGIFFHLNESVATPSGRNRQQTILPISSLLVWHSSLSEQALSHTDSNLAFQSLDLSLHCTEHARRKEQFWRMPLCRTLLLQWFHDDDEISLTSISVIHQL